MGSEERELPGVVRREPCGCIRNQTSGHALLVCTSHVTGVEGHARPSFRIRNEHGELILVNGRSPNNDHALADRVAPEVAQTKLDALASLIRASMPGAVRLAFVEELSDLRDMVRSPHQRDSFARGVWAGWSSLLTEITSRVAREPEPAIQNLDLLAKEPPGHA